MLKERFLLPVVVLLLVCGLYTTSAGADIGLFDWAFNINGTLTVPGDLLPSEIDASGFDFDTGLGTVKVRIGTPGSHFVGMFVDHELSQALNTYFNESGEAVGTPAVGQSWEIDEPGYINGDIYENLQGSLLDNAIGTSIYGNTTFPDDVSMALAWNFVVPDLGGGEWAEVVFHLGTAVPLGSFYLRHFDPDSGENVYFSSDLSVVPLPGAALLASFGLGSAGWCLRRCRKYRD
jgi:hypothetical protein